MLKIQNLKKYFGGVKAVDDCSFEVKPKTITALIGPNGAGKSTVFNLVSGTLKADSGKIVFKEKEITNLSPEKISNLGISRLFQQTMLFNNLTIKENLLLAFDNGDTKFWKNLLGFYPVKCRFTLLNAASRQFRQKRNYLTGQATTQLFSKRAGLFNRASKIAKEKEEKIKEMLKLINMEEFENTLARDLSYGQKRLVELLRTILNPHQFLMLDEPVAGVNPKLREKITEILLKLKDKGETILLIEHDMNFTLNIADTVIVMEKGKVIAQGKPDEIRSNPEVLQAYLGE